MRRTILIVTFLALTGCQQSSSGRDQPGQPGQPDQPGQPAPGPALTIGVTDRAGGTGPFRIRDLEFLTVAVSYTGAGEHSVRLDVVDPRGTVFARLPAKLQAGEAGWHGSRRVQIRGTPVDALHRVGTWQVVANLDGVPQASAAVDLTE